VQPGHRRVLPRKWIADKTVRVWDAGSGKLLRTLEGHTGLGHEHSLVAGRALPGQRISGQTIRSGCGTGKLLHASKNRKTGS